MSDYAALYLKLLSAQPLTVADISSFLSAYAGDVRLPYVKPLEHLVTLENLTAIDPEREALVAHGLTAAEALEKNLNRESGDDACNNDYKRRTQDIMTYTYAKLEPLYVSAKQSGKAYLAKQRGDIVLDDIKVGEIRELQALQSQSALNRLEQKMAADFAKAFGGVDYETGQFVLNNDPDELTPA